MNRHPESSAELPFAVRLEMLRRKRRAGAFRRLTSEALWLVLLAAVGLLFVSGLLGAIGRA
jgi:hypothetical protein